MNGLKKTPLASKFQNSANNIKNKQKNTISYLF